MSTGGTTPNRTPLPYLFPVLINGELSIRSLDPDQEEPWPRLTQTFREKNTVQPYLFSRPEYQLEPLFYLACRTCNLAVTAGSVYNMPLSRMIVSRYKPDMLVATPELAKVLLSNLKKNGQEIPFRDLFLFAGDAKALEYFDTESLPYTYDTHPLYS